MSLKRKDTTPSEVIAIEDDSEQSQPRRSPRPPSHPFYGNLGPNDNMTREPSPPSSSSSSPSWPTPPTPPSTSPATTKPRSKVTRPSINLAINIDQQIQAEEMEMKQMQLAELRAKKARLIAYMEEHKDPPANSEVPPGKTNTNPNNNPNNINIGCDIGHNINVGSPPIPPPISSNGDESKVITALLARICDYPATQAIAPTLHASSKQREDARKGKFVSLANFLPSQTARIHTSQSTDTNSASKLLAEAMESLTEEGLANNAAKRNAGTPKFKEFGDVVIAFVGGLIPIACVDRPDRFADYTSFILEILLQHSTGRQHWPVLLHAIESIRRAKQPTGEGATMDRTREVHKLCDYPLPSSRLVSVVDPNTLAVSSNMFNDMGLRSTLIREFIDPQVLQTIGRTTLPEAERINKLFATPHNPNASSPFQQSSGSNTAGTKRFESGRIALSPEDNALARQHSACLKFLQGICSDPCPASRPHETIQSLRSRPRSSPTQNTNSKQEGSPN